MQPWSVCTCLVLVLPGLASQLRSFENTAVVRSIELGGSLVHITTTYAIKALEPGSDLYTIALTPEEHSKTSWIQAKVKGEQSPLDIRGDPGLDTHNVVVRLPKPMTVNSTLNLVLETVQTHVTRPWPEAAAQDQDQALKYNTSLFVLSPYKTTVQRTKIRVPTPQVHSYTEPTNVEKFTLDAPVTKSGATITYGPYNDVPSSSNQAFIEKYQMPVVIHYNHNQPVIQIKKLRRAVEISHWGANSNIQDEIHLYNAGPTLKGQFSRILYQTQNFFKRVAPHILFSVTLQLPPGIHDAYVYDLIGNVSTSRLRTSPLSSGRNSVLEFKPRYPLMGGWNYSFTLGWDAPLANSLRWDGVNGRYVAQVPIMTMFPDAVVDDAEVKIVLPEGAIDVEAFPTVPPVSSTLSTHVTYLDTIGRPALIFQYEQLTDKHVGSIYVWYRLPFLAHLRKPVAVASIFFGLFMLAMAGRRVDLKIHKSA